MDSDLGSVIFSNQGSRQYIVFQGTYVYCQKKKTDNDRNQSPSKNSKPKLHRIIIKT